MQQGLGDAEVGGELTGRNSVKPSTIPNRTDKKILVQDPSQVVDGTNSIAEKSLNKSWKP